jgi:hypothetical protein
MDNCIKEFKKKFKFKEGQKFSTSKDTYIMVFEYYLKIGNKPCASFRYENIERLGKTRYVFEKGLIQDNYKQLK